MRFLCSSRSNKDDEQQPIHVKDSNTNRISQPCGQLAAPLDKEEPKEPKGPSVEPATSLKVFSKPAAERTALSLEPLLPSKPEPQQEGADEAKAADVVDGGLESFINNESPVCETEKQLWAAVEELAPEAGVERGMEINEIIEERAERSREEECVTGG